MKKLTQTLALNLLLGLGSTTNAQSFLGWESNDTTVFKITGSGTAEYHQTQGGFRKTITSQKLFISPDTSQKISFLISGFTNGGFNSCTTEPQMLIDLLDEDGNFISNIDSFQLDNQTVNFGFMNDKTGTYRISVTIFTEGCKNNSFPKITLSNLTIPLIFLPNRMSEVFGRFEEGSVELSWNIYQNEGLSKLKIFKFGSESWVEIFGQDIFETTGLEYFYSDETPNPINESYKIVLIDLYGEIIEEKTLTILTSQNTGNSRIIMVYPNPIENSSLLHFLKPDITNSPCTVSVSIINTKGVKIAEFSNVTEIDISSLPNGTYFAIGRDGEGNQFKIKFINLNQNYLIGPYILV
jgi:hypothetical protein